MPRARIKPSKGVSLLVVVGGLVMVVIGVTWVIPTFGAFGFAWTFFALAITGYHAFNVFSDKGAAVQEIDVEGFGGMPVVENNAANRLEQLESLRSRALITEEEYQEKRTQIIKQL